MSNTSTDHVFELSSDLDALLRPEEAAAFLEFTPRALEAWRHRGGGPQFVRVSARAVRYRRRDLLAWVEARLRVSTADPGPDTDQIDH